MGEMKYLCSKEVNICSNADEMEAFLSDQNELQKVSSWNYFKNV